MNGHFKEEKHKAITHMARDSNSLIFKKKHLLRKNRIL